METNQLVATFATLRPSSTFLWIKGYKSEKSGEVSNVCLSFHCSYRNALIKSVEIMTEFVPATDLEAEAKNALLTSWNNSLQRMAATDIEDIEDGYTRFFDADGRYIKGIKQNIATGQLHIYALVNSKVVLQPGVYKEVKSRPLTIEKARLQRSLNVPVCRFRQYIIANADTISVEGLALDGDDAYDVE